MGGSQQSNRDDEGERRQRRGGIVAGGCEVDRPANKRLCHKERHAEEEEVGDPMATTGEDAAGMGMVAAGWDDDDNETREMTAWVNKRWWRQWTNGGGATRGRCGQ
jgi:hypothetical protein